MRNGESHYFCTKNSIHKLRPKRYWIMDIEWNRYSVQNEYLVYWKKLYVLTGIWQSLLVSRYSFQSLVDVPGPLKTALDDIFRIKEFWLKKVDGCRRTKCWTEIIIKLFNKSRKVEMKWFYFHTTIQSMLNKIHNSNCQNSIFAILQKLTKIKSLFHLVLFSKFSWSVSFKWTHCMYRFCF